jgi:hypothetical protein
MASFDEAFDLRKWVHVTGSRYSMAGNMDIKESIDGIAPSVTPSVTGHILRSELFGGTSGFVNLNPTALLSTTTIL